MSLSWEIQRSKSFSIVKYVTHLIDFTGALRLLLTKCAYDAKVYSMLFSNFFEDDCPQTQIMPYICLNKAGTIIMLNYGWLSKTAFLLSHWKFYWSSLIWLQKLTNLYLDIREADPKFAKQPIVLCIKLHISDYMPEI